jgi:hypothetical protein
MKDKRKKVDFISEDQIPQSPMQAVLSLFWPLNTRAKKIIFFIFIVFVASFAIWVSLPEITKTDIIAYVKGGNNTPTPVIVIPSKTPAINTQKDIKQNTKGDQSPAVVSGGDVHIDIDSKQK